MLLVFIDETSDEKLKDYLGFCIATINSRFYPLIKTKAQKILSEIGWEPAVEFKGSYLFSSSHGCADIEIEKRIDVAHDLLYLNMATSRRRMKFYFGRMKSEHHRQDYLTSLPSLLHNALPKPHKGGAGKNLLHITCDERSDISLDDLHESLGQSLLLEDMYFLRE